MPGPLRLLFRKSLPYNNIDFSTWALSGSTFPHIALDRAVCNTDKCDTHPLTSQMRLTNSYAIFVASQLSPTPISTTSGTDKSAACSISCLTNAIRSSPS